MKVKLIPKTHKGKNKIREAGTAEWSIVRESAKVGFSDKPGPWLLVSPDIPVETGGPANRAVMLSRWVHKTQDADFVIEVTE